MIAGRPFAMVTKQNVWVLVLTYAQGCAWVNRSGNLPVLIVILGQVARRRIEIAGLEKYAVFVRDLLFEARGQIELLQIIIRTISLLRPVIRIQRVAGVAENPVLRPALNPITAAKLFGAGKYSGAVRINKFRIFLL